MAATEAVNGAVHPRPNNGSGSVPSSGQQDPGPRGISQDLGPSSHPQHHIPARPIFYVPTPPQPPPPPPPFLQYQWPMPFPYNPFAGFPGMGYGMVMPTYPPPPYMEPSAYILPHHNIQPVDYRRLLHAQVHPSNAPYQNQNHTRRIHLPQNIPVRETVNCAVQTEPTLNGIGSYDDRSDSGHGTTSSSSSPSSSSSQKPGPAEDQNYTYKDLQTNQTSTNAIEKHGFNNPHLPNTVQKCQKDCNGQKNTPLARTGRGNMWSVSSQDSIAPVCSSSQEDEVVKERRVSFPDILMSWGNETEVEYAKSVNQNQTKPKTGPGVDVSADKNENILCSKDVETSVKILKLPLDLHELHLESRKENEPGGLSGSMKQSLLYRDESLHSLNKSNLLPHNEQEHGNEINPHDDATDIIPYRTKRRMDESVWSVESLAPFIPTKEWLLHKGMFETEEIIEMTDEAEGLLSTSNDNLNVRADKVISQSCRCPAPHSVLSDSCVNFSTPARKSPPKNRVIHSETDDSELRRPKQIDAKAPVVKKPVVSLLPRSSKMLLTPTEEDVDENGSSEPEAYQSPNQESLILIVQQDKSPEHEDLLNSVIGEKTCPTDQLVLLHGEDTAAFGNKEISHLTNEQLCVPMPNQRMSEISPSKGYLVDAGTQCTEFGCQCMESKSRFGPSRRRSLNYSDTRKGNGDKPEGFSMNGNSEHSWQKNQKRQRKNRGQDGSGRYPRY